MAGSCKDRKSEVKEVTLVFQPLLTWGQFGLAILIQEQLCIVKVKKRQRGKRLVSHLLTIDGSNRKLLKMRFHDLLESIFGGLRRYVSYVDLHCGIGQGFARPKVDEERRLEDEEKW